MAFGHAGEAGELGPVAMKGDDEGAVDGRARIGVAPKRETAQAELAHHGLGAFLLAIRRQHGAGIEAAGIGEGVGRTLAQRHLVAAPRQSERLPQADDAGTADGDLAALRHD